MPLLNLTKEQIEEKIKYIDHYIHSQNSASGSLVDANANVDTKNIGILEAEMYKPDTIQVNRAMVQRKLTEKYGKKIAEKYIEDIEKHRIYIHDETSLRPYCASITLFPFLLHGTKPLGGTSEAPKNIHSFCGSFVNLVYQVASGFAGAIATVEFLLYFDYFAKKTWGTDYLNLHTAEVRQALQGVVYALNQPASARGNQSVFWNISVLDRFYFEQLFGGFKFPDGTQPVYEGTFRKLQMFFMEWFRQERERALLTYPVLTASLLVDEEGKPKDKHFAWTCAEEMSKGLSFFVYESDSVDSLSSCCFDGSQKVLVRNEDGVKLLPIRDVPSMKNMTIFYNGSWVKGSYVKAQPTEKMYKITTSNKKELFCTSNHVFPTLEGDKFASDLTTEDYLLTNTRPYNDTTKDGTYSEGFLIGMYLGDGSRDKNDVVLSLSDAKIEKAMKFFKGEDNWRIHIYDNHNVSARTSSQDVRYLINKYVFGKYAYTKELNMDVCNKSLAFRQGILDGYYHTDGGNSNRIYSTSEKLIYQMEALLTTMGITTAIDVSDRTEEPVVIRGEIFKRNFPLYCLRWYSINNKRRVKDTYKVCLTGTYFKIKDIQEVTNYSEPVYCFNMNEQAEPYFTLANGITTHNCRLRNEFTDNTFSYTLGAGGVSTGSVQVITINMNRYVQTREEPFSTLLDRVHMYLLAHRAVIEDYIEGGLLPAYSTGFISLDKQFCTIGINGMLEASEYVKGKADTDFFSSYLKDIYESNKDWKEDTGVKFNTEFVPKISGHIAA